MKRTISTFLALCMVIALFSVIPTFTGITAGAYAAPVDINGNAKSSATFIIDPGHGGTDPGACLGSREEADDVLKLSLAIGKYIIKAGQSVAFTRITDFYNSPSAKASAANSGSYSYFVSVHRNAASGTAYGYETYYYGSSSTTSAKLATSIHNSVVGVGCWRNRGIKTASYTVLTNTNMPAVLLEVGFIDNTSDNTIFDTYFDANAKAIANGMLAMVGSSVPENEVTAPSVTVNSVVSYGSELSVSWGSVANATSYKYSAAVYQGEMSATSATTLVSSTTTGTSFTVPAQNSGKYISITVTAVGPNNTASTTKTVMVGPYYGSYPSDVQYIPVNDINGSTSTSNSTIWTKAKGSTFAAVYWRAYLCSANSDGTYTVKTVYDYNTSKSVTVSGTDILFAIHSSYTNYKYTDSISAGDVLTLCGIYLDNATIRGTGYVLVNGGIPLYPDSLSLKSDSNVSCDDTYLVGTALGTVANDLVAQFNEDAQYVKVYDGAGNEVTDGKVGTGYTVNLVIEGDVVSSYTVVISGDVNGDGDITTSDALSLRLSIKSTITLEGAYMKASDIDGSDTVDTTDYVMMMVNLG